MTAKTRAMFFATAILALLAALPAFASGAPAQATPVQAAPALGCAGSALPAFLAVPSAETTAAAPAAASGLEGLLAQSTTKFHGYCRCSCSFVKDCNTSADCGGAPCIAAISCC